MATNFIMQVIVEGVSAVIGVNRAHHVVEPTGIGVSIILPVNEWIMPEGNKLTVLLARPESQRTDLKPPSADVHLFTSAPGSRHNEPLATLSRFTWPLPAPAPSPLPFIAELPFKVVDPPPCTLWTDAAKIETITDADRLSIIHLVESFRSALERGDVDGAYSFMEYRYRDNARSDGSDYPSLAAGIRDLYREMLADRNLKSEPLSTTNAVFTLAGDNRVVLVSRGLGKDAVRMVSAEQGKRRAYGFKIYVAKIQGKWTIVR